MGAARALLHVVVGVLLCTESAWAVWVALSPAFWPPPPPLPINGGPTTRTHAEGLVKADIGPGPSHVDGPDGTGGVDMGKETIENDFALDNPSDSVWYAHTNYVHNIPTGTLPRFYKFLYPEWYSSYNLANRPESARGGMGLEGGVEGSPMPIPGQARVPGGGAGANDVGVGSDSVYGRGAALGAAIGGGTYQANGIRTPLEDYWASRFGGQASVVDPHYPFVYRTNTHDYAVDQHGQPNLSPPLTPPPMFPPQGPGTRQTGEVPPNSSPFPGLSTRYNPSPGSNHVITVPLQPHVYSQMNSSPFPGNNHPGQSPLGVPTGFRLVPNPYYISPNRARHGYTTRICAGLASSVGWMEHYAPDPFYTTIQDAIDERMHDEEEEDQTEREDEEEDDYPRQHPHDYRRGDKHPEGLSPKTELDEIDSGARWTHKRGVSDFSGGETADGGSRTGWRWLKKGHLGTDYEDRELFTGPTEQGGVKKHSTQGQRQTPPLM